MNRYLNKFCVLAFSVSTSLAAYSQADTAMEQRIDELVSKMTLQEKIGQMNQLTGTGLSDDMKSMIRAGKVGSILNELDVDTICSPVERNDILYQWKTDEHLLRRNTFIGDCYNEFQERKDAPTLLRVMMANYILEGIYFYSGFMFFYNLSRNGKMSGSAQEIRYINRDENTHLWLFRNIITELQKEQPELFTAESVQALREMMREGVEQEIAWGHYVIGDDIPGLNRQMISDYIRYLGNLRWTSLGYPALYPGFESEPESMEWVSQYADANMVKTDFFEARSTAYAKSTALIDDL